MLKAKPSYLLVLVLFFIGLWLWKASSEKKKDEYVLDGIHIPRQPLISAMNEIYGEAVDSGKVCDCLVPAFYKFIKNDSVLLEKFKEVGLFALDEERNQQFLPVFEDCLRRNIADSNYVLKFNEPYLTAFKAKLRRMLGSVNNFSLSRNESIADCIMQKLHNSGITMLEYLAPDYLQQPKTRQVILECVGEIEK